jgi:hypothetical protein
LEFPIGKTKEESKEGRGLIDCPITEHYYLGLVGVVGFKVGRSFYWYLTVWCNLKEFKPYHYIVFFELD